MWRVLFIVVGLLATDAMGSAEPERVTDRGDRAIFTIRVDQKGSSYIIHPDLSRLEAEALLLSARPNGTSFFYNVTGLATDVDEARASPYQSTASANPASKLLLEALLHNINADKSSIEQQRQQQQQQSAVGDQEWVVHNGDPISVEDVTHKVFHAATNRVSVAQHHQHHPLLAPLAHKPEQLIPSSLVKATPHRTTINKVLTSTTSPATTKSTTRPTRPTQSIRPSSPSTTRKTTTTSTTTKSTTKVTSTRPENPSLRLIDSPPEDEQEFYDEEYEDEYEEVTTSTAAPTRATTRPQTVAALSTNKAIKTTTSAVPGRPQPPTTEKTSPVGITYIPLNSNKNGILTLAKMNATAPPVRLPEYTVKTGVSSGNAGNPVSSSSLITKTEPATSSSSTTTSSTTTTTTTTTTEAFDLAQFLVRVAGEASELLMEPSISSSTAKPTTTTVPQRHIPSMIDGSIFGTLFSADHKKRPDGPVRLSRPDNPLAGRPLHPPPPQRGSVHNLNRPSLFSAFNQPPEVVAVQKPTNSRERNGQQHPVGPVVNHSRPNRPTEQGGKQQQQQQQQSRPDDVVSHHTQPNTDALIPLYSSAGQPVTTGMARVTEQPSEVDVITAPSQWNLIVSSSLTSSGQKAQKENRVPVPSTSLSHRHGYIVDEIDAAAEAPELIQATVTGDGLLQHQDSPSRLGVAIDYDGPNMKISNVDESKLLPAGRPTSANPADYLSYEDYEDYAEAAETAARHNSSLLSDRKGPTVLSVGPVDPQSKPPFPYGVNLGDLNDSKEDLTHLPATVNSSEELEGFGAAFPEVISNTLRRTGAPASIPTSQPPRHYLDVEERRPEVFHTEQAIDAFDKKFRTVEVDANLPVNTTTIPEDEVLHSSSSELSGAALTYILIGTFGGLSLLFLCAVGITIRCRKRRFMFNTFTTTLMRRSDQRRVGDEESQSGSPNVLTGRRLANQQLAAGSGGKEGEVATHKLGSWFTGRNSMSSLHGGSQISGTRKLRAEVALPRTTPNTPGRASTRSKVVTRAYFTDGRTGSTRDLITSTTASSESSGTDTPVHSPGSPHPPDRNSWLHTSYKDRGNSLSELRDSPFYCITQADTASSDGERPRSTSATVRSPLHHFRSTEDLDSIDPTPPDLPPKRQHRFSVGDSMSGVDPMGSHLTIQTEASVTNNWATSVDDRLI